MSIKKLKVIRDFVICGSVLLNLIVWILMPSFFRSVGSIHFFDSEYISKYVALPFVPVPFAFYIPSNKFEEIHTDDPIEHQKIAEKRKEKVVKSQLIETLICESILLSTFIVTFFIAA